MNMEWKKINPHEEWDLDLDFPEIPAGFYLVTDGKNFGVFRHGKFKGLKELNLFIKPHWKRGAQEKRFDWTHYFPHRLEPPSK